jgi:hypothetical protein
LLDDPAEIVMQRNRKTQEKRFATDAVRDSERGDAQESSRSASGAQNDELVGQLGPDELPDPEEVVMSKQAKHRS